MTQASPLRFQVAGAAGEPPCKGLRAGCAQLWFREAPTIAEPTRQVVVACSHIACCFAGILQALAWLG